MRQLIEMAIANQPKQTEDLETLIGKQKQLKELGFTNATIDLKSEIALHHKFLKITEPMIRNYLKLKWKEKYPKAKIDDIREVGNETDKEIKISGLIKRGWIENTWEKISWYERPIAEVKVAPSKNVLDKFIKAKQLNIFDFYSVASTDESIFITPERKDPLLLGGFKNSSDKYLIGIWGSDIILDDLI